MGIIRGICTSDIRGIQKSEVQEADIEVDWGIVGDAHGGKWHRQISLLSLERIQEFRERGADVEFGAFGENIIAEGYDFKNLPVGSRFQIGEVILEMSQSLPDLSENGGLYHAKRRRVCTGDPRRTY